MKMILLVLGLGSCYAVGQSMDMAIQFAEPAIADWDAFLLMAKGASGLTWGIAALLLVQLLFLLCRTVLGDMLGIHKILILALLCPLANISVGILAGKSVFESIFSNSAVLWSFQIAGAQIVKQWQKRKEDARKLDEFRHHKRLFKRKASK